MNCQEQLALEIAKLNYAKAAINSGECAAWELREFYAVADDNIKRIEELTAHIAAHPEIFA